MRPLRILKRWIHRTLQLGSDRYLLFIKIESREGDAQPGKTNKGNFVADDWDALPLRRLDNFSHRANRYSETIDHYTFVCLVTLPMNEK